MKEPLICRIFGHKYVNAIFTDVRPVKVEGRNMIEFTECPFKQPRCKRCGVKLK